MIVGLSLAIRLQRIDTPLGRHCEERHFQGEKDERYRRRSAGAEIKIEDQTGNSLRHSKIGLKHGGCALG